MLSALVKPTRRMLIVFALVTAVGWALLVLTFICWDGVDSAGQPVGACEPVGGNISWLVVPVGAYLLAALLTTRRTPRARS